MSSRWCSLGPTGLLLLPVLVLSLDDQCKDPLFASHWEGKIGFSTNLGGHIHVLNGIPTVETGLELCPQFNGKDSCCNSGFEEEQLKFFNFVKGMLLPAKLEWIAEHRESVRDVMHTAEYQAASKAESEQLGLALERFNAVLHPSVNGPCFSEILTYAAGMNCFACRPDWFAYTTQSTAVDNVILRVHVHASACLQLWTKCEVFGEAAIELKQALLDSALAKQAKKPSEDLDMFSDQQTLCHWLHDIVALHPFRRPTEAEREAAHRRSHRRSGGNGGGRAQQSRRLLQNSSDEGGGTDGKGRAFFSHVKRDRRLFEGDQGPESENIRQGRGEIDVLWEGRASNFDTKWAEDAHSSRPTDSWLVTLLALTATLHALAPMGRI